MWKSSKIVTKLFKLDFTRYLMARNNIDFSALKEGELVTIVKHAQPVLFEGIKRSRGLKAKDLAVVLYLDPINGLRKTELPLDAHGRLIHNGHNVTDVYVGSEEGRKYLKLISDYKG